MLRNIMRVPSSWVVKLLIDRPSSSGAQASIAVLSRVGGALAVNHCRDVVNERGTLAVEAALALGVLPGSADDAALLACLDDPFTDVTLRAAAACSLATDVLIRQGSHAPQEKGSSGNPKGILRKP